MIFKNTSTILFISMVISALAHLFVLFYGTSVSRVQYKLVEKNSIQVSVIEDRRKAPKEGIKKVVSSKKFAKKQVVSSPVNSKRQELIDRYLSSVQKVIIETLIENKGRKKLLGELTVGVVVLNNGTITDVSIDKSSGGEFFDSFVTNIILQIDALPILPTNDKKIQLKIPIRFI